MSSAFISSRLSPTTFLIKEHNDIFSEHPLIFLKLLQHLNTIILIDTGCAGRTNDPDVRVTSLRRFIETVGVDDNHGRPLNENGACRYVVITTHCHYDHILAIEQFSDSQILASSHSPSFLSPTNLPTHSLCDSLNLTTPSYTPTLVPHMHRINLTDTPTPLIIIHTPGHTPDQLAVYDEQDAMLYVGDTVYEHEPIIFPNEGSIVDWLATIDLLTQFVKDTAPIPEKVKINAGHVTAAQPALEVLASSKTFMRDVLEGREEVVRKFEKRGEVNVVYRQQIGGGRYSLICPERLVKEAM